MFLFFFLLVIFAIKHQNVLCLHKLTQYSLCFLVPCYTCSDSCLHNKKLRCFNWSDTVFELYMYYFTINLSFSFIYTPSVRGLCYMHTGSKYSITKENGFIIWRIKANSCRHFLTLHNRPDQKNDFFNLLFLVPPQVICYWYRCLLVFHLCCGHAWIVALILYSVPFHANKGI